MDTIECIRPSTSAWDVPRDDTMNHAAVGQWAARVTLANALSSLSECADFVIEDKLSIVRGVTSTAIFVCQSCGSQSLELVWSGSTSDCSSSLKKCAHRQSLNDSTRSYVNSQLTHPVTTALIPPPTKADPRAMMATLGPSGKGASTPTTPTLKKNEIWLEQMQVLQQ